MNNAETRRERRNRQQRAVINITPLLDVLLILVAVLMLAMPLFVKRLPVALPHTTLGSMPVPVVSLAISLRQDGVVLLNGMATPLDDVVERVTQQTSVEIAADKEVRYEALAQLVAKVQAKGPKEIVLLTR